MNKSELVSAVSEKAGVAKSVVEGVLNAFDEVVVEGLKADGRVRIGALGFLNASYRGPRQGRNPKDPTAVYNKEETVAPTFKASEMLKTAIATPEVIASVKAKKK